MCGSKLPHILRLRWQIKTHKLIFGVLNADRVQFYSSVVMCGAVKLDLISFGILIVSMAIVKPF
jgi:hypothetical protein